MHALQVSHSFPPVDRPVAPKPAVAKPAVAELLRQPGIWRHGAGSAAFSACATGHAALDAVLPGGGWPLGALTEVLAAADGLGELSILMPALARLTQRGQRVVWVNSPYLPYAPALRQQGLDLRQLTRIDTDAGEDAWSVEQCLRSGGAAAVLCWLPEIDYAALRRLQLAAEAGGALAFVFRPLSMAAQTSPAALRISIEPSDNGSSTWRILKCRGRTESAAPSFLRRLA